MDKLTAIGVSHKRNLVYETSGGYFVSVDKLGAVYELEPHEFREFGGKSTIVCYAGDTYWDSETQQTLTLINKEKVGFAFLDHEFKIQTTWMTEEDVLKYIERPTIYLLRSE